MPAATALHIHELHTDNWGNTAPTPVQFQAVDGLQLVLGPNEAGKTTLMRAIRGFVRGLLSGDPAPRPLQSATVRARVRLDGTECWLQRNGHDGVHSPLRDDSGALVALESDWPAPSPLVYDTIFCLDHDTLRAGGRQLGRSDTGTLGTLLFASIADAGRLAQVQKDSEETISSLYSPAGNARKQVINRAVRGMTDANQQIREAQVTHEDHRQRQEALRDAADTLASRDADWREADARKVSLDGLIKQLPSLEALRRNESDQAAIRAEGPTPDGDWAERAREAQQALHSARTAHQAAQRALADREMELAAIQVDEAILERAEDIRHAHGRLDGYTTDRDALPDAQRGLQVAQADWEAAIQALGMTPTEAATPSALPTDAERAELRGALDALTPALTAEAGTRVALVDAQTALEALGNGHDPDADPPQRSQSLVDALTAARQDQADAADRQARAAALDQEAQAIVRAARALRLPCTDPTGLEALALPSTVRRQELQATLQARTQAMETAQDRLDDLQREQEALEAELRDTTRQGDAPSMAALRALRDARDAELGLALSDPATPPSAAWRAVVAADHAADQRYLEAEALGALEARQARLAQLVVRVQEAADVLAQAMNDRKALDVEWAAESAALGLPSMGPAELPGWLDDVQALRNRASALQTDRANHAQEATRCETRLDQLRGVLRTLQDPADPALPAEAAALLDAAQRIRERLDDAVADHQAQTAAREAANTGLQAAQARHDAARQACDAPRQRWDAARARFDPRGSITPEAAPVWLAALTRACHTNGERDRAQAQVTRLKDRITAFETSAAALAGFGDPHLPADTRIEWLEARLAEETVNATNRGNGARERDRAQEALDAARIATTQAGSTVTALVSEAGLPGPEAIDAARDRAARLVQLQEQATVLLQALGGAAPDEIELAVAGRDLPALQADRDTASRERDDLEARRNAAREALRLAQADFDAVDGTAAAAEAAQARADHQSAALEAVEALLLERACAFLTAQLQEELARSAQNGPVDRAGEVFSTLTLGAFQGLRVEQRDEAGTPLRYVTGVRSNGERVAPAQMSDGTRDALWLSLRVAAIEDLLAQGHRVPVVLDDVAVHLDDARAQAMLQVFGALASQTQVLLFTHHRAMVDAAVAAGVPHAVLELDPRATDTRPLNLDPPDPGPRPTGLASIPVRAASEPRRTRRRSAQTSVELGSTVDAILDHLQRHPDGCSKADLVGRGLVSEADWSAVRKALDHHQGVTTEGRTRSRRYRLAEASAAVEIPLPA